MTKQKTIKMDILKFLEKNNDNNFKIFCHSDGDGLFSALIIKKVLNHHNIDSSIEPINYGETLEESKNYDGYCIYIDIGANAFINNEKAIIIDHHKPNNGNCNNVAIEWNCHHYGIDGVVECCGSTMAYLLASELNIKEAFKLGALGATCDMQWKKYQSFIGENEPFNAFSLKELKRESDKVATSLMKDLDITIKYLQDASHSAQLEKWYNEYYQALMIGINGIYYTVEEYEKVFIAWVGDGEIVGGKINTECCHLFDKPLITLMKEDDDEIGISLRVGDSTPTHDWGKIFNHLNIGGGHDVACGAKIQEEELNEFISNINDENIIDKFSY